MKEHPILFSTEMVRAILSERKTQTRRAIKPQPSEAGLDWIEWEGFSAWQDSMLTLEEGSQRTCPYGQPGDLLWVRETWKAEELPDDTTEYQPGLDGIRYKSDNFFRPIENTMEAAEAWGEASRPGNKWRPSIFMPRWASRITLGIQNIKAERVQEISGKDVLAEGIDSHVHPDAEYFTASQRECFSKLWDSINAKRGYSLESNSWVWVIEFKRV